ncbi:hypothetical protein [Desnuesiella massiliensis]|uniref:hypothetical protein n=1 Tax=Desnuesiella massiliensis TaxID=1650662 RepID=UPI0006E182CC|nr:hypothetical protein [Desnuesiella massiliensis]
MRFKKIYVYIIIALLLLCTLYLYPRKFNNSYNAIIYRLGDKSHSENIQINIEGWISNRFFRSPSFKGTIFIGEKKLSDINMKFDKNNKADIFYFDEASGEYRSYGFIVAKNIRKQFTVGISEAKNPDDSAKHWSSKDGLMLSAPANNRDEALEISKNLMKPLINSSILK